MCPMHSYMPPLLAFFFNHLSTRVFIVATASRNFRDEAETGLISRIGCEVLNVFSFFSEKLSDFLMRKRR